MLGRLGKGAAPSNTVGRIIAHTAAAERWHRSSLSTASAAAEVAANGGLGLGWRAAGSTTGKVCGFHRGDSDTIA